MSKTKASSIENSASSPARDLRPAEIPQYVSYFPLRVREKSAQQTKDPKSILQRLRNNKLAAGFTHQQPISQSHQVKETSIQKEISNNSGPPRPHHQRTLTWTDIDHMRDQREESQQLTLQSFQNSDRRTRRDRKESSKEKQPEAPDRQMNRTPSTGNK